MATMARYMAQNKCCIIIIIILRKEYSLTFPPKFYSKVLIYTAMSELRHCGENENAQASKGDTNPGCFDCEYGVFSLSYGSEHSLTGGTGGRKAYYTGMAN